MRPLGCVYDDGGRSAAGYKSMNVRDCVARSIAIATGRPYKIVYRELNELSQYLFPKYRGRNRYPARNGIRPSLYGCYLLELGWTWEAMPPGCRFRREDLPTTRPLLVKVFRHLSVVCGNTVRDREDARERKVYGVYHPPKRRLG